LTEHRNGGPIIEVVRAATIASAPDRNLTPEELAAF